VREMARGCSRFVLLLILSAAVVAGVPRAHAVVQAMEVVGDAVDLVGRGGIHRNARGGSEIVSPDPVGGERPFTLRTHVRLGDSARVGGAREIALLALKPAGDRGRPREEDSPSFAVAWVKDTSSFWPRWQLRVTLRNERGEAEVLLRADASPVAGHEYETFAGFDPLSGTVSVRVDDRTSGETVLASAYRAEGLRIAGYPAAGASAVAMPQEHPPAGQESPAVAEPPADLLAFTLYELYAPVATTWRVEAGSAPQGSFVPVRTLGAGDYARIRIANPVPSGRGSFRVVAAGRPDPLATAAGDMVEALVPLDRSALSVGTTTLFLEYVVGDAVLLRDAMPVTLGRASIYVTPVDVDREAGAIEATLRLTSTHATTLKLNVAAQLYRMTWNAAAKAYEHTLYRTEPAFTGTIDVVPGQEAAVPLRIPLPSEEGLWRVAFEPTLEPALGMTASGAVRHLSTYAPFDRSQGRPFAIAVLPDTQYYARSYPDILIRQAHWIAENAASRNIALVLHVGDITDNNTELQWERARDGMGILHGVVPYVLAVGNHDILVGNVADREKSLVDAYFARDLFPTLKGTFDRGISNSYHTVEIGGEKYLVVALEFGPRDAVLAWASDVVAAHPDHKVIVLTHTYTARNGQRVTPATSAGSPELVLPPGTSDVNNAEGMWSKFVRNHPNILMVVSGHLGGNTIAHNVSLGANRNFV